MLAATLILFLISFATGWVALYILSAKLETLNSIVPVSAHSRYSLSEQFFERLEALALDMQERAVKFFYRFIFVLLNNFLPWFRRATRRFESRLVHLLNSIKGKQELPLNRDGASQFVKDMREHANNIPDGKIE